MFANSESYLVIKQLFVLDEPETGEFLEALERLEGDELVDEDVGHPQAVHELHVDGQPVGVELVPPGDQSVLGPHDPEVHAQGHGELLVVDLEHVQNLGTETIFQSNSTDCYFAFDKKMAIKKKKP